ncbi:hypothetical protein [Kitasatospora phosalacinea]|uniref:Uncharacterized protein n=1 Tax=Kitasatospora phosalacinea TaxID=2065 RepID=A0A9W6PBT4_9ACTN|nr:hypothetical protein [Kitasatospora phosalacinea]GLW52066.1 hypothetical protein Kpho01_00770 [Kitasatospora phosalacinea]
MTTTVPTPRRPAATVAPTSLHGLLRTLTHRDPLIRYALPGALAALLPLLWFRPTHPTLTPGGAPQ